MKKLLFVVVCGAALASCSDDTNLRDKYGKHTKRGLALAGPDSSRNAGAKKSAANQSDEKEKEERGGRDGQNDSAVGTDNGGDRGQDELCPLLVYDTQFPNLPPFDPCPKVFVNINGNKRLNTDDAFALMVTDTINRLSGTQYLNPSTNVTGPVYTNGPHGFDTGNWIRVYRFNGSQPVYWATESWAWCVGHWPTGPASSVPPF